jgi:hypothetical protein
MSRTLSRSLLQALKNLKKACHSLAEVISAYLQRTRKYSNIRFIFELVSLDFVLRASLVIFPETLINTDGESNTERLAQEGLWVLFLVGVILAPALETIIGQWLPIKVASLFTNNKFYIVLFSALFFSSLHLPGGLTIFFVVLPGGLVLAWSFLIKREESCLKAYWITAVIHGLANLVSIIIYLFEKSYGLT